MTKESTKESTKATKATKAAPTIAKKDATPKMNKSGVILYGAGSKGHSVITAPQLAQALGMTDGGKRLRGWLRSRGNDHVYSRYGFDVDSKAGVALVEAAMARFNVDKLKPIS